MPHDFGRTSAILSRSVRANLSAGANLKAPPASPEASACIIISVRLARDALAHGRPAHRTQARSYPGGGCRRLQPPDEPGRGRARCATSRPTWANSSNRASPPTAAASSSAPATACSSISRAPSKRCAVPSPSSPAWPNGTARRPRTPASNSGSASTSATSSSRATTSMATASTSPRVSRASLIRARFSSRAPSAIRCATSSRSCWRIWASGR